MRIWLMSDLHTEFEPFVAPDPLPNVDVCVVAGDFGIGGVIPAMTWLEREIAPLMEVVFVAGNHDFYDTAHVDAIREAKQPFSRFVGVHFLENDSVTIRGVTFIGCTLWTDFALNGYAELAMFDASQAMNDYRRILNSKRPFQRFNPLRSLRAHKQSRAYLESALAVASGLTVVVILRTLEDDPRFESFSLREFYERHQIGEIKIDEGFFSDRKKVYKPNPDFTFRSYPPQKRAKALFYAELIKAYESLVKRVGEIPRSVDHLGPHMEALTMEALNITRALMAEETIKGFRPRSVGQFNKMYRKFVDAGRVVEALIDGDNGPGVIAANVVDPESMALWRAHAEGYADSLQPSQRDKYEDLEAELHEVNKDREKAGVFKLRKPSFKVFRKHIKQVSAYHIHYKRKSKAEADRKFGISNGGFGLFKPGERVDIDEKEVDLMALLEPFGRQASPRCRRQHVRDRP